MRRFISLLFLVGAPIVGCSMVPQSQLDRSREYANDLRHQLDGAKGQISTLKDEVAKDQQQIAKLESEINGHKEVQTVLEDRVKNLRAETSRWNEDVAGAVMNAGGAHGLSPGVLRTVSGSSTANFQLPASLVRSLTDLSSRDRRVVFDPTERVLRLTCDVLFTVGDQPRPDAQSLVADLARLLNGSEAKSLNILIVGHTSTAPIRPELLSQHPTNWHLAAHQAIAVQESLEELGVSATRVGIISYAGYQPLVHGTDDVAKRRNERIEIYLLPPDPSG